MNVFVCLLCNSHPTQNFHLIKTSALSRSDFFDSFKTIQSCSDIPFCNPPVLVRQSNSRVSCFDICSFYLVLLLVTLLRTLVPAAQSCGFKGFSRGQEDLPLLSLGHIIRRMRKLRLPKVRMMSPSHCRPEFADIPFTWVLVPS